jgi:hypothetical protein
VDATVVRAHQHAAGARGRAPADVEAGRLAPAVLSAPGAREGLSRITRTGGVRTVAGRADQQDSLARRFGVPAAGPGDQLGAAPRLAGVRAADGPAAHCPRRPRASADPARPRARRQGLLQHRDPRPPAAAPHQSDDPAARRPGARPAAARQLRRPAARVRPRRLQAAQHRGTGFRQAAPAPRGGHQVRQTRLRLARNRRIIATPRNNTCGCARA